MSRGARAGTSFVETLVAATLALLLMGMVGAGIWAWSRQRGKLEVNERALSTAAARLELLVSLPADRRPQPGSYTHADWKDDPDLARVLEPREVRGRTLAFEMVVEEHPVEYPDFFFGGSQPIPYLDFRRFRLRVRDEGLALELVVLK